MKKYRIFAMLLALVMLLSLLGGCGGASSETAPEAETAAAESVSTPVEEEELFVPDAPVVESVQESAAESVPSYTIPISEEPLTYSIWMTYAPFAAELVDVNTMEGMLVLDTLQEVTNIHFDVSAVNGAAEQDNFNLMIAAGDYTDIISSMGFYATGLEGAVEEGIVQDLADVLPEKCPIYWSYLSANDSTLMTAYTDSGYMPALCIVTPEIGQEVIGPILRGDWLDEFGMEIPKTYDDLYAYLETAYNEKGAIFDIASSTGIVSELANGLNIAVGGYAVVDGVVEYGNVQEEFKEYLKFVNKLYENKIISQDFFTDTAADLSSAARLNFGLGTNSLVNTSAINTSDIVMNVTDDAFEMVVMPYVSIDGTTEPHVGPDTLMDTMKDADPWCFSTECEDIDPLLQMVEYIFSDEGYLLTNYGVEGVSYELDDEGNPQYTDLVINNPDGLSFFFASYVYATNAASGFFPYINDMSKTCYAFNDNQWQVFEDLKKLSDCEYSYPPYALMNTEETGTYSSIESDLSTYAEEKVLEFIVGTADIDAEFDEYVETLYDMGLQEMIDMKQAAYERAIARMEAFTAA